MLTTRPDSSTGRPASRPRQHRSLRDALWLWVAYLLGTVLMVLLTAPMTEDLARGAGDATPEGQAAYLVAGVVVMLAGLAIAMVRWWWLPPRAERMDVVNQLLCGTALAAIAGLTTLAVLNLVSSMRYAQLPPPVDTSFMQFVIGFELVLVGLGVLVYLGAVRLMLGSRKSSAARPSSHG